MSELPVGEKWGEFPTPRRQQELELKLEEWKQESDHGDRLGPFHSFKLTGADIFWLAARAVGAGGIAAARKIFDDPGFASSVKLHLEGADLRRAQLQGARFNFAQLQRANLAGAQLQDANLFVVQLWSASLNGASLQGARLSFAKLQGANLRNAQLCGAHLFECDLRGAHLQRAKMDGDTQLITPRLDTLVEVADVAWNNVSLNQVDWEQVPRLGEEVVARQVITEDDVFGWKLPEKPEKRLNDYRAAARAYRQLAIALRGQGIAEVADRFTYRALIMQRKALWWQMRTLPLPAKPPEEDAKKEVQGSPVLGSGRHFVQLGWQWLIRVFSIGRLVGPYLFSWFLAVLTGYGFRMSRIVVAYLLLICGFAAAYYNVGVNHPRDMSFWTAIIVSVTAFHGRVFTNPFTPNIPDAQVVITAIEAVVGLIIEGVFIAMLTQRFFNR